MPIPSTIVRTRCVLPIAALLLTLAACTGSATGSAIDTATPRGVRASVPRDQDPVMPAPTPPPSSSVAPAPAGSDATQPCNADAAQSFIGQLATDENVAAARAAAGPTASVRVIAPGMAVTMDFRPDRLNIEVDAQRVIVKLRCG